MTWLLGKPLPLRMYCVHYQDELAHQSNAQMSYDKKSDIVLHLALHNRFYLVERSTILLKNAALYDSTLNVHYSAVLKRLASTGW